MIADGEYVPDLKNISDGQLFALIAAKDDLAHAAYRVLYDRYAQLIWSLCCDAGSKLVAGIKNNLSRNFSRRP